MDIIDEITKQPKGAEFFRADLHIHSFGASYDVTDATMTPENIVGTAAKENLRIIGITDHNSISNVEGALKYAITKNVFVVPGVELSTPQGHLLVYCPTFRDLEGFYGKLSISSDKKMCNDTIPQCLSKASEFNGFGIAAHIDLSSGFELMMPKYDPFKEEVLKCKNLIGLELGSATNESWYTDRDENENRRLFLARRRQHLGLEPTYDLAKIVSSDAHTLAALGKNAAGARKLTRLKLESFTFDALRIALIDSSARTRIEDLIPTDIPRFVGMKIDGGFLDGQIVHFSRNLTCIIGGRGAGKSTLIESLRCGSGNPARESLVDSEVWPDEIHVVYQDEAARQQVLLKSKSEPLVNITSSDEGLTQIPIESYGQGETAETIQHCDRDPGILLTFLDLFIDFGDLKKRDAEVCQKLLENQTLMERLSLEIQTIPDLIRVKNNAEAQLKALKEKEAAQVVELEEKLAKERLFREELKQNLSDFLKAIKESLSDTSTIDSVLKMDDKAFAVGKEELDKVKEVITQFSEKIRKFSGDIDAECGIAMAAIAGHLQQWTQKERDTQAEIEKIRKQLEEKGIRLDMAFIRKVTKDFTDFTAKLKDLTTKKGNLGKAEKERKELIAERRLVKSQQFSKRQAFAVTLTDNLRKTVVDYTVSVKFLDGVHAPALEDLLVSTLGWRTSRVPKAQLIASQVSPFALMDGIKGKNSVILEAVKDHEGNAVFTSADAADLLQTLHNHPTFLNALHRCAFDDRPEIKVTKEYIKADKSKGFTTKDFSKLSLGQQQSILLCVLLFSKSQSPLIIDQPEDNLDSEFIYKTFVSTLRSVKERRQVIVVTHNANIAVLGDAEMIIPLRGSNDKAVIRDRGSIDNDATKKIACTILEGSKEAFKKRATMYGIY